MLLSALEPSTARWRLDIELSDRGRRRTVSLQFAERATVDAQLTAIAYQTNDAFRLLEFRNEAGEILAVLARAYVTHVVRSV